MAWLHLLIASAAEIVWAYTLKASDGFTKPLMVAFNVAALLTAVWFLVQAMRTLPLGTAYAVWTGIGVVGAAVLGIVQPGLIMLFLALVMHDAKAYSDHPHTHDQSQKKHLPRRKPATDDEAIRNKIQSQHKNRLRPHTGIGVLGNAFR